MFKMLAATALVVLSVGVSGDAHAGTMIFSGILKNDIDYQRPSYTIPKTPALNCVACGYHSQNISVSESGSYQFSLSDSNFIQYVGVLYMDEFDQSNPIENLVGNFSYRIQTNDAPLSITLAANVQYVWVTSTDYGYAANNCGGGCTFTMNVTGLGDIAAAVPEPSTWAMMMMGFGGLGAALRSRRRLVVAQA